MDSTKNKHLVLGKIKTKDSKGKLC